MMKIRINRIFQIIVIIMLVALLLPMPVSADCPTTIEVNITSGPYALVDSNKPLEEGPMVATVSAVVANTGASTAENVYVYIGNGTTPGSFGLGSDGTTILTLLGSMIDAIRYIGKIEPGQSKTIFWQLDYPPTYGVTYPFTVWASNEDGCTTTDDGTLQTRSALSASANKLLGTISIDPPSGIVNPGNLLTVILTAFNFGQVGAGPNNEEDVWLQPVGNLDFDPSCFRLVRTEAYIHSIENISPYGGMPVTDQFYFNGIRSQNPLPNYKYNVNDYIRYYFVALKPCSTTIKPYNEVASGNVEKYSGDYDDIATTIVVTSESGGLHFDKSVDPTTGGSGDTLTWTMTYGNTTVYPIGDPATGNGLVVIDEGIPENTTYVAGSAAYSNDCSIFYSTDNGTTWTSVEPAPEQVTMISWHINDVLPASTDPAGNVSFQTTINDGTSSDTIICNSASARIGNGETLTSWTICANASHDPMIEATKTGPSSANVGDTVTYNIMVEHVDSSDGSPVSALSVTDSIAGAATYVSGDTNTNDKLDDGETWTYEATYTIKSTDLSPLENTAIASGTDEDGETVDDESNTHSLDIDYPIKIEMTKVDSPAPVEAGQNITYTVTITNSGTLASSDNPGNEFEDIIPINTAYSADTIAINGIPNDDDTGDGIGYDSINTKIIWNGAVPAGGSITIVFQVAVDSPLVDGTLISNQGMFYWDMNGDGTNDAFEPSDDPQTGVDDDPTITTVSSAPVLTISKDDWPEPVQAGETLTYTIIYQNIGNEVAHNVVITELYDENVSFSSASPPPDSGNNIWNIGDLSPADGQKTMTINVTVNSPLPDGTKLSNYVAITCDEGVTEDDTEETTVSSEAVLLLSKADNPDPVPVASILTYTLTYQNTGTATASDTVITDTLPAEVSYVSAVPTPTSISDGTLTWNIGDLVPDGPYTVTITVRVNTAIANGTVITNYANITCSLGTGADAEDTTIISSPVLAMEKTASPDPVEAGGTLTYTITVTNSGNTDATNVVVTEIYDANFNFSSATPSPDAGTNNQWTFASIAAGDTETIIITGTVLNEGERSLHNVVSYISNNAGSASATEDTTVHAAAPPPVGGEAYPVNKLAVLAPWIALFAAIMAGAAIIWRRRRTQS